jgi:phosphoribosylformylglycinamidine (FGAM) synthase-like amidotransferase family enzyme
MTAKVLILAGYGLNCEEETLFAFDHVGLKPQIRHINDLIENPKELNETQILVVPGGFSYGDDTGSGNAFAQKMKLSLWEPIQKFIARDTLTLGICNGCQIITNLGLTPPAGKKYGERLVAVTYNLTARYQCRWIDVKVSAPKSPWLTGIETLHIPVGHGEGRFMMEPAVLKTLEKKGQVALQYIKPPHKSSPPHPALPPLGGGSRRKASTGGGELKLAKGEFPFNPNGSINDIAAVTDQTGRILATMPHPERGMFMHQRDDYDILKDRAAREGKKLPEESDGMKIFKNAAAYFSVKTRKRA